MCLKTAICSLWQIKCIELDDIRVFHNKWGSLSIRFSILSISDYIKGYNQKTASYDCLGEMLRYHSPRKNKIPSTIWTECPPSNTEINDKDDDDSIKLTAIECLVCIMHHIHYIIFT